MLELDITLKDSKPKIWRRVLVPEDMNFHELHYVIQFAMGWSHSHLHQFIVGRYSAASGYLLATMILTKRRTAGKSKSTPS
ncbi:MAG: plasmid pRiA4b ORF-3 family protein [Saprospiraceae bacterium]|nr:plasmid pRiA4b ORF-3 family protein [Saprospiraceae bacterium]